MIGGEGHNRLRLNPVRLRLSDNDRLANWMRVARAANT